MSLRKDLSNSVKRAAKKKAAAPLQEDAGLVSMQEPVVLSGVMINGEHAWLEELKALEGFEHGVLIMHEVQKLFGRGEALVAARLTELIEKREGVLILTGHDGETQDFLNRHPTLKNLLPAPLSMDVPPEPTQEEIAKEKRNQIISEWQDMKNVTVHVEKPLRVSGTARFRKEQTPVK